MKRIASFGLAVLIFLVPSCAIRSWAEPSATPIETTSARNEEDITPSATQIPKAQILIDTPRIFEDSQTGTVVLGIIHNDSDQYLSDISLQVSLFDTNGDQVGQQRVAPLLGHLAPGEDSPYTARFESLDASASAEVELLHSEVASFDRAAVEFQEVRTFTTQAGEYAILGTVNNPSNETLTLHDLGILVKDDSGDAIAISRLAAGPANLMPEQTSPVLLLSSTSPDAGGGELYVDATINPALPPVELSFTHDPSLEFTDQGLPFVLGEIHNDAGYIRWVRVLIAAYYKDLLLSCSVTTFPIPIGPDENRAFLESRLPGLATNAESQGIALENVEIQAIIELNFSRGFDETPVPLSVEIDRYQYQGSSLILHGKVSNTEENAIEQPTVLGTVRTMTGELVSAGWSIVADTLAPFETLEFVLPLTLPHDTDPVMSEFDLQAVGFFP